MFEEIRNYNNSGKVRPLCYLRCMFTTLCINSQLIDFPCQAFYVRFFFVLQYPEACGPYKIKYIRDLTVGYDNSKPDCKPVSRAY